MPHATSSSSRATSSSSSNGEAITLSKHFSESNQDQAPTGLPPGVPLHDWSHHEYTIMTVLYDSQSLTIEEMLERVPGLSWSQIFLAIGRLSRKGAIALHRHGFTYTIETIHYRQSKETRIGRRLLIIDNDPHICEGLKDRLEAMGYSVIVAHDGRTGLAMMALEGKDTPIGGVILDVQMPVMDGIEVLQELRIHHKNVPVLMMSAGGDRGILEQALAMGADHYIMKPFEARSLAIRCEELFPLDDRRA